MHLLELLVKFISVLVSDDNFCRLLVSLFFRNINSLKQVIDSDQARHFVRPDLGPNCLQRLSAADNICHLQVKP